MSKAIIITRAIKEHPDFKEIRMFLQQTDVFKIAVNHAGAKGNIRLFVDWFHWREYLRYEEQLVTNVVGCIGLSDHPPIPPEYHERFFFFKAGRTIGSSDIQELCVFPSSLGAAMDLAYKMGYQEILLLADNKVKIDGVNFLPGFKEQSDFVVSEYAKRIKVCQYTYGEFSLPVESLEDFCS